ncbi:MAG: DNA adenine methylase [Flavobacteriales bacterium]
MNSSIEVGTKPFLKWAGGKTQLLHELHALAPEEFNTYIEPFIGGGALFFSLTNPRSIISDSNDELIITYHQVRDNVEGVIAELSDYEHTEQFYYDLRGKNTYEMSALQRAARLIYLNKTCFNGLYRVNKKGQFNVPYGKGKGNFLNKAGLQAASARLKGVTILHDDYASVLSSNSQTGDFVFLDPPYHPVGKYSDFKRYTKEFFYENDQIELCKVFKSLVEKGCHVLLTNSDHPFILELYQEFEIRIIETKRMISSKSSSRKGKDIIVIGK